MSDKMFMKVEEVAEVMEVSIPFAYKVIRQMNEELKQKGCFVFAGRVDRKFFYEHFYGTSEGKAGGEKYVR